MACRDAAVRTETVSTVRHIADAGLLDEDDCKKVLKLMYDDSEKVRELASPLISQIWKDDYLEKQQEKARAALGPSYEDDVKSRWVELKAFCQMLIEQCEGMTEDGRSDAAVNAENNGPGEKEAVTSLQSSQSGSQTRSLSQSQNDFLEEEYETDGDVEERKKEFTDLYHWAKRLDGVSGDLLDQRVAVAVAGLWNHMDFLHVRIKIRLSVDERN